MSNSRTLPKNRIVPLAMKVGSLYAKFLHLNRCHLDAGRILPCIQSRLDSKPWGGAGTADEADDDLATFQGLAAPVGSNVTEHVMFNLIPLARAWRQMADTDTKSAVIGEALQLPLPEPSS